MAQDQNELGAMMAAQNELAGLNAGRLQNSQEEQAFLQQQQAANAVMMQAAQIGTSGGGELQQQVGTMNPQTQAILAQYGVMGAPQPGKTSSSSKTTQNGNNIKIENTTTTNNDIKIINPSTGGGGDSSVVANQAKFQTWLNNAFAKQSQDYEVQRRMFSRRDRDLEKQSNKMMREMEKATKTLGERLNPKVWAAEQGGEMKKVFTILLLTVAPALVKPIAEGIKGITKIFEGTDGKEDSKFTKSIKSALGYTEKDYNEKIPIPEKLGRIFGSGINRIIDKLDLLQQDRETAIRQIPTPKAKFSEKNDDAAWWRIGDWLEYLGNVTAAAFGGSKSLIKTASNNLKKESIKISEETRAGETMIQRDQLSLEDIRSSNVRNVMTSSDWNPITGGLKNGINSQLAFTNTIVSMANNTSGVGYSTAIMSLMSKAKKSITKDTGLILGNDLTTERFLKIFNASMKAFIEKKYIKKKEFYHIDKTTVPSKLWNLLNIHAAHTINGLTDEFGFEFYDTNQMANSYEQQNYLLIDKNKYFEIINQEGKGQGGGNLKNISSLVLWELTEGGLKALEHSVGGSSFTFDELNSENLNAMHFSLEHNIHGGKKLKRDVDLTELHTAEGIHYTYVLKNQEINNRDDDYSRAVQGISKLVSDSIDKIWTGSSFIGGDSSGRYKNTNEGKIDFCKDMMGLYTTELISYYKSKGLSDEEARQKASMVAQWLVAQDAMETNWGHSIIGDFNYGNITAGSSWSGPIKKHKDTGDAKWRVYDSPEVYIKDKIKLLSGLYDGALMSNNLDEFSNKLQSGKYKYSTSDTEVEYHNKIANHLDSVTTRLKTSDDWRIPTPTQESPKQLSEEKSNENIEDNSIYSFQDDNFKFQVNKKELDLHNNPEKSIQNINVVLPNGAEMGFDAYYRDLNAVEKDVLELSIRKEASRSLLYNSNPKLDYSERNTENDVSSIKYPLGWYSDTNNFSLEAKEQLCYFNKNNNPQHLGANIYYYVYLTKDLKSWKIIETNYSFYWKDPTNSDKIIYSGKILYNKDKNFPEELYKATNRNRDSIRNPLMAMLHVNLTPKALEDLKQLLLNASKEYRINNNVLEYLENNNWVKADSSDLIFLNKSGFITTSDPINGLEGLQFTDKYRNYVEGNEALKNSFEISGKEKLIQQTNGFSTSPFWQVNLNQLSHGVSTVGQSAISSGVSWFSNTGFGKGFISTVKGDDQSTNLTSSTSSNEENKLQNTPQVVNVTEGSNNVYNDNTSIHYNCYYQNVNPSDITSS